MKLIDDVIAKLPPAPADVELPAPPYRRKVDSGIRVGLAVESMRRHMTDEGWQLFQGLSRGGGYGLFCGTINSSDVKDILDKYDPLVVILQDKREWVGKTAGGPGGFDPRETFTNVGALRDRSDVFKVTVLKDAQSDRRLHVEAAEEIGCHGWIVYYHPRIVKRLAPFVRERHLVRTWHSVDAGLVPRFDDKWWDANCRRAVKRDGCLLSGAMSNAYPLRKKIFDWHHRGELVGTMHLPHPGYHRNGCDTPEYLSRLSQFKVAVCTSSVYGYALRKIVEATACGCRVITNLPQDEVMPHIDCNLARIGDDIQPGQMRDLIRRLVEEYDPTFQETMSSVCKGWYDFREVGRRLAEDIETLRKVYNS